jgi:hypothetical protein
LLARLCLLTSLSVTSSGESASTTFSFQLSKSEYSSLFRRGNLSTPRLRGLLSILLAMTVVGFLLRSTSERDVGRPLFGIGFAFLIVFGVFVVFMGASAGWKRDPTLASTQSVTITEQGVILTTSDRTITLDWQRVSSAIEIQKGFFFVFTGPPTVVLVPKRAITKEQDLTYIRRFVPKPFFRISRT